MDPLRNAGLTGALKCFASARRYAATIERTKTRGKNLAARNISARRTLSGEPKLKEAAVDWNRIEGNWKQMKGKIKEKWGRLTDDDLDVIEGHRDQLEGKIQERYGLARDQIRKDVDQWLNATG
jgi:uncharacterized protein YjbJ (UPF0337 family)